MPKAITARNCKISIAFDLIITQWFKCHGKGWKREWGDCSMHSNNSTPHLNTPQWAIPKRSCAQNRTGYLLCPVVLPFGQHLSHMTINSVQSLNNNDMNHSGQQACWEVVRVKYSTCANQHLVSQSWQSFESRLAHPTGPLKIKKSSHAVVSSLSAFKNTAHWIHSRPDIMSLEIESYKSCEPCAMPWHD